MSRIRLLEKLSQCTTIQTQTLDQLWVITRNDFLKVPLHNFLKYFSYNWLFFSNFTLSNSHVWSKMLSNLTPNYNSKAGALPFVYEGLPFSLNKIIIHQKRPHPLKWKARFTKNREEQRRHLHNMIFRPDNFNDTNVNGKACDFRTKITKTYGIWLCPLFSFPVSPPASINLNLFLKSSSDPVSNLTSNNNDMKGKFGTQNGYFIEKKWMAFTIH